MSVTGRVVLVTGGTGALGRAVTGAFVEAGEAVAVTFRTESEVPESRAALANHGQAPIFIQADVSREAEVQRTMESVAKRLGRIDVLLHLVGGYVGDLPVAQMPEETWDRMLATNLKSAFLCCKHVVPVMRANRWGRIVTVSSRAAVKVFPGISAYAAAKAGLLAFTEVLAGEVRDEGITVNTVLPSVIDTPANRRAMPDADPSPWVKPEEIARLMLFLCTDAAKEISGAAIPIYGRA
jgi:NAD(P)-dependent dehydrogenase (short-subunit alcohol dehydrogenase family)